MIGTRQSAERETMARTLPSLRWMAFWTGLLVAVFVTDLHSNLHHVDSVLAYFDTFAADYDFVVGESSRSVIVIVVVVPS